MDFGSANFAVFKEPKAFIKVLQVILAIIAFALTTNFSSSTQVSINCNNNINNVTQSENLKYSYPFKIDDTIIKDICKKDNVNVVYGNFKSQSEFYVFVGVITMLYCFAAMILYVFFVDASYQNERIPKADFIITLILAIFWFIASVAWADGVSKLKIYTSPGYLIGVICSDIASATCHAVKTGVYGGLEASLVGGFGNVLLWIGNLWFVYKDTLWYDRRSHDDQMMPNESLDGGNM